MFRITQIINDIFASNTYVISEESSLDYWLVDVGDFDKVINFIPTGSVIKGVLLTHTHFDHIYGIKKLCQRFPGCKVYTSEYGAQAMCSEKLNFSLYHENPVRYEGQNLEILKEPDVIKLFGKYSLHVFETPGHCPSCLTYAIDKFIFTGDSFIPDYPVVTRLPRSNKELAQKSKIKIIELSESRIICAGHGPIVEM